MVVTVEVVATEKDRPPAGAPVIVRVRDTALQDAPAIVLGEAQGIVSGNQGVSLVTVEVPVNGTGEEPTVWAHVDVDRDGRVSQHDFVTKQSYPLPPGPEPRLEVLVSRV